MITPDQALTGLGAIVGGGGVSAMVVAVVGYLTEARKGRRPSYGAVTVALGDAYGQAKWAELSAGHLAALAQALTRAVAILEVEAEARFKGRDFHDRLENKLWRALWPKEGGGPPPKP